jgi:5'-nucleotidase
MRILVTNDDGIYSPGIAALAAIASPFGDVRIVAPDVERSSAGHSISSTRPLTVRRTRIAEFEAFRVDGTPADAVALGVSRWDGVELVLSGINLGLNLGNAMWHSGTLAAARQAALLGLRGIAFSTPTANDEPDFDKLGPHVAKVLDLLIREPSLCLVNVNLPAHPAGYLWTRQSVRHYDGHIVPGRDPLGREHFWFTVRAIEAVDEETDRWALERGLVSITPLELDLTDHAQLRRVRDAHPLP